MRLRLIDPRDPAWWCVWPWRQSGQYAEQDALVAERGYGLTYADFWDEPDLNDGSEGGP